MKHKWDANGTLMKQRRKQSQEQQTDTRRKGSIKKKKRCDRIGSESKAYERHACKKKY